MGRLLAPQILDYSRVNQDEHSSLVAQNVFDEEKNYIT
jgi:hypothetical protein